jgi:Domain of unknown function DUF29
MKKTFPQEQAESSLYDFDFYAWTQDAAESLRQGRLSERDLERVAEEIADMGRRDRRELRSRTVVLVAHLLKWAVQPKLRRKSTWLSTINEQKLQIEEILSDSPSLIAGLREELPAIHQKAAIWAASETGLSYSSFIPPIDADALGSRLRQGLLLMKWLSSDFLPEDLNDLFR